MNKILDISIHKELGIGVPTIYLDQQRKYCDVYRLSRIDGTKAVYVSAGIRIRNQDELKKIWPEELK